MKNLVSYAGYVLNATVGCVAGVALDYVWREGMWTQWRWPISVLSVGMVILSVTFVAFADRGPTDATTESTSGENQA